MVFSSKTIDDSQSIIDSGLYSKIYLIAAVDPLYSFYSFIVDIIICGEHSVVVAVSVVSLISFALTLHLCYTRSIHTKWHTEQYHRNSDDDKYFDEGESLVFWFFRVLEL